MSVASEPSLGRKVAAAAGVMVAGRLAIRLISIFSTLILVRLLVPEDFGIIALASAIFAIADTLTATGYAILLVRRAAVDRDAYDTAWTMNLIRCLLLCVLVALTAPLQAWTFGEPRIAPVLLVISGTIALDGFMSIGLARLQRELRFDLLFRHQVAQRLLSFILTVALALILGNYWCLVLGNLAAKLITVPYSYLLAPHRPRFCLSHWREFFGFSKWMFCFNLCLAADGQSPNLTLGAAVGVAAVGSYNAAYQISATPVTEVAVPVRQPLYAGYARVQDDAVLLRHHFLDSLGLLAAVIIPLSVGISLVAPEVERIALGARWEGTAPLIVLCALYSLADSFAHFTFNVFTLKDRFRMLVVTYIGLVFFRLPVILLGVWLGGTVGLLVGMLVSASTNMVVWNWQAARLLGHRLSDTVQRVWRSFTAAALMAVVVLATRQWVPPDQAGLIDDTWRLAFLAGIGAAVHSITQAVLWRLVGRPAGPEERMTNILRSTWMGMRLRLANVMNR